MALSAQQINELNIAAQRIAQGAPGADDQRNLDYAKRTYGFVPSTGSIAGSLPPTGADISTSAPAAPLASTQVPTAPATIGVFGKALDEMRTKFTQNQDLEQQKRAILTQLYDRPLAPEQLAALTPSQQLAIKSNNRNLIDMELRLISDTQKGRTDTLDTSVKYLTDLYQKDLDNAAEERKNAIQTVLDFSKVYGENTGAALKAVYGPDILAKLTSQGIDLAGLAKVEIPATAADKYIKASPGDLIFNTKTQQFITAPGGTGGFTVDIPEGSLAATNNNPGNLRYVGQAGASQGAGGFARFETPEAGYQALIDQIQLDQSRGGTLEQYITKYAPPSENNTEQYITQAESALGLPRTTPLADINANQLAQFQANKESGTSLTPIESDVQINAESLLRGDLVPSFISAFGQARNKAIAEANRLSEKLYGKPYNAAQAQIQYEAAKRFATSQNSAQTNRFRGLAESVVNTIDEVKDLAGQLKLSGITPLNKLKLEAYVKLNGNSPTGQLVSQYLGAVNTLKEEFANLANGGYAPTESAWSLANSQINENYGVDQLAASLAEVQRLINYRVNAITSLGPLIPGSATPAPTSTGSTNDPLGIR